MAAHDKSGLSLRLAISTAPMRTMSQRPMTLLLVPGLLTNG